MKEFLLIFIILGALTVGFLWSLYETGEQVRASIRAAEQQARVNHEHLRLNYNRLALKRHKPELTKEEVAPITTLQLQLMYSKLLED